MKRLFLLFVSFFICCWTMNVVIAFESKSTSLSLDWDHVNLVDALHYVGTILHENILLDHAIQGDVTLHVKHMQATQVFQLLLHSHQLICVFLGNTWLIVPEHEWEVDKQNRFKTQESLANVAPLVVHTWRIRYAKAIDIAHVLQENGNAMLSKRGHIQVDPRTNLLFVEDIVGQIKIIDALIKQMDVPLKQILIETYLASVDSDFERDLGVEFVAQSSLGSQNDISRFKYSLLVATLADHSLLNVRLAALEEAGHAELVSSPRLFTANQQTAEIVSGEEIPYQEESQSGGTTVVFKKAVLSLKVTPQLLPHHRLLLQIHLNQDKPSKLIVHGVPAINTRQLTTNVLALDGQTIVLGGIYETDDTHGTQSVPVLGAIPLLGELFKERNTTRKRRELLIFVTPHVIC